MMKKILIIEDSPTTRAVIRVYLLGHDLEFIEASDGLEGIRIARKQRPRVIVVDLKMPGMDGFTFCREVRADATLCSLPIILLTGAKGDTLRREAMQAGATYFMNKPIDQRALAQTILRCVDGKHEAGPTK